MNNTWPKLAGILPLNPQGEISPLDFMAQATDMADARMRAQSNFTQISLNVLMTLVFLRNTWQAIRLVQCQLCNVASWCCLIQAGMGAIFGLCTLSSALSSGPVCRVNGWMGAFGMTVSSVCISVCLLVKAYAVQMRDRRLLWFASLLLLPQGVTLWAAWIESDIVNTVHSACVVYLPAYYPWFRSALEISTNIVFSCIFLSAAVGQYRIFGSQCWRKLSADGLIYLILVIASNIATATLTAFLTFGLLSEMIYLLEWMMTSCLMIRQQERLQIEFTPKKRRRSSCYSKSHTMHILLLSQRSTDRPCFLLS
ncbi:hypothetical protein BDF19DRAFT_428779 [Syncephalis fuscata]|nr:hypothetical protein BDF19DRAFT_428779 [Syncephalis fuscata]